MTLVPTIAKHRHLTRLSMLAVVLTLAGCEAALPVALEEPIEIRIVGRVTDAETGTPLDSVDVWIASGRLFIDDVIHASTTTDADGLYEVSHVFEDECPGDLRILTFGYADRYRDEVVDLECTGGARQVDFDLVRHDSGREGGEYDAPYSETAANSAHALERPEHPTR